MALAGGIAGLVRHFKAKDSGRSLDGGPASATPSTDKTAQRSHDADHPFRAQAAVALKLCSHRLALCLRHVAEMNAQETPCWTADEIV